MISLASAMYAGESKTFDLEHEIVNCSIIGNTYNLEGLDLTWEDTNFTISTVVNYKPDNFMISCWVIKYKEEIVVSVSSSSGSSGSSSSSSSIIYVVDNVSGKDYGDASKYHRYNVEETVEETVEEYLPNKETIIIEPLTEEEKSYWKLWLPGIILILVTFILFKLATIKSHSSKHASHEQEENTNEKEVKIK